MRLQWLLVLPLVLSTHAIKVAIDKESSETAPVTTAKPIYYISDEATVDSYLIPPDPHRPEDVLPDVIVTPATYLLPPAPNQAADFYYAPTEPGEQTDWYPIGIPESESSAIPIFASPNHTEIFQVVDKVRKGKSQEKKHGLQPTPSVHLEPPPEDDPNDYIISYEEEASQETPASYELPLLVKKKPFRPTPSGPLLPLHLLPPHPEPTLLYKKPTKLYPKKVTGGFRPVPIPIAQFADEVLEPPRARPANPFKPYPTNAYEHEPLIDEKLHYQLKKAEEKRKEKFRAESQEQTSKPVSNESPEFAYVPSEQETSATNYKHPGRNAYPAPLKQEPPAVPAADSASAPAPAERTEFRMHGLKGPHSYQFGYDTGKGKNRQFRFEERDNDGSVRGHYGYMDRHGKLRVVNYRAHPEHGFQADPAVEKL